MSANRSQPGPHRLALAAMGVSAISLLGARPVRAAAPIYTDIMPLRQIKPGMTGYGLTTFRGTHISKFNVKVVGILRKVNNGHDLVLIRMQGGPITERGANLIQGMSGSPIYINGKCIGAFSQGETWPKEPIGMVTPIEDMLEAWDPDIPQIPPYFQPAGKSNTQIRDSRERRISLAQPIRLGDRQIRSLVLNARPGTKALSDGNTAVLHRATTYAVVSGVTEKERAWFQKELDRRGYAFTLGQAPSMAAGKTNLPATPLRPGSCFGTFLSSGDVEFGAFGTVTYRKGDRILGFGHPFFGFGALNAAATSASVIDVFSGVQVSHLIAEAGPVVGTITQDRNFSVSVELHRKPIQIPFDITVRDETTHRNQTFHSQIFQHPDLTPALLTLISKAAISRVHNTPGDVMARVTTTVEAGEVGKISRSNLCFDADDIAGPAVQDLTEINSVVSGNPFYPLPIKRASMTIDLYSGHNTATLERIFLKQGRYEPGDNLEIGVVLKPYRREPIIKTLSLKIPSDTPNGRYILSVRGGPPAVLRLGGLILAGAADPQTPPTNVGQMIARLNNRERSTDMVARLLLNTGAPALEGEKLSQLPPNLAVLMRSDRNSGVRIERDELRSVAPSDYVLSGTQQLYVTVQKKNTQEPGGGLNLNGGNSLTPPVGAPSIGTPTGGASLPTGGLQEESVRSEERVRRPLDSTTENFGLSPATQRWLDLLRFDTTIVAGEHPLSSALPAGRRANTPETKQEQTGEADTRADTQEIATPELASRQGTASGTASKEGASGSDTEQIRIVGRQLQTWRQSGATGFGSGKFVGTSVAATGELRLAPRLRRLASTNETYLWSLVADAQGNLYAGTGTTGKVLKIDPAGKVTTFAQLPVVAIQSLLLAHDGTLWAGSSVRGKLFHIGLDGTVSHIATLPERYLTALCEDSRGNIYAGTGSGGKLYKIPAGYRSKDPDRTDSLPVFVTTGGDYITAMTIDPQDNLYVGTGNEGILYKVTPDGRSTVLYDAKENSITALALDRGGNLYAGTGPRGLLYRIAPDGTANVIYDRASSFYTGIRLARDGTLYATTVNAAYHIYPGHLYPGHLYPGQLYSSQFPAQDPTQGSTKNAAQNATPGASISVTRPTSSGASHFVSGSPTGVPDESPTLVQPLDNPRDVDFLTLALLPNSSDTSSDSNSDSVAIGTGNIGEVYTSRSEAGDRAPLTGTFESVIHDNRQISRWGTIRTVALLPKGATLEVATRTGNVAEPDATWSRWETPLALGQGEGRIMSPPARFIQYRLTLRASTRQDATATAVREVSISYLPRNQAPKVSFLAPLGGERWAKSQNIRWLGSDPDNDTLSYEIFYSQDGTTWRPLPSNTSGGGAKSDSSNGQPTPQSVSNSPGLINKTETGKSEETRPDPIAAAQRALDAQPNVPDAIKQQILESARLRQQNRQGAAEQRGETGTTGEAQSDGGSQRNTSRPFDTRGLPDGTYWLKVVASDIASNPADPQTVQIISEPFIIVNAPPSLALKGKPVVGTDRRVTVNGEATQQLIAITAVQYRVDGGDWLSAVPKDGLFDSTQERFTFTTAPLPKNTSDKNTSDKNTSDKNTSDKNTSDKNTSDKNTSKHTSMHTLIHTLEIVAFNAANNRVVLKLEISVD